MNTTAPWDSTRSSAERRGATKHSARAPGQSLGDWLDDIVAERATELGVSTTAVAADERLEAVAAQLTRLASRQPARADAAAAEATRPDGTASVSHDGTGHGAGTQLRPRGSGMIEGGRPDRLPTGRTGFISAAVAEIARRQAALDDGAITPVSGSVASAAETTPAGASRPARTNATRTAFGRALQALESRLGPGEAPRTETETVAPPTASLAAPRPVESASAPPAKDIPDAAPIVVPEGPAMAPAASRGASRFLDAAMEERPPAPGDPAGTAAALEAQLRGIERRIERIGADLPRGDLIARIGEQTQEVRDLLAAAATRPSSTAQVERQIASIESRLDNQARRPAGPEPEIDGTLAEIRSLLERFRPGSTLDAVERKLDDLSGKLATGWDDRAPHELFKDLVRRFDETHASLRDQLTAAAVDTRPLEILVRGIADRIEDSQKASAGLKGLEATIRTLSERVGDGSPADAASSRALEGLLQRVAERLDRSEGNLAALDGVEHSLSELFTQIEETRRATVDAAETAARTAARDTLRAAMQGATGLPQLAARQTGTGDEVAQTMADLRAMQDASDQRMEVTLGRMSRLLETLVDRLSTRDSGAAPTRAMAEDSRSGAPLPSQTRADPAQGGMGPNHPMRRAGDLGRDRLDALGEAELDQTLIEPGSGRAPLRTPPEAPGEGARVSAGGAPPVATPIAQDDGPAGYIAAARRAALAAQASAAASASRPERVRPGAAARTGSAPVVLERARAFLAKRRRPILLGIAGLVLLLGALEVVKLSMEAPEQAKVGSVQPAVLPSAASPIVAASTVPAASAEAAPRSSPREVAALPPLPSMALGLPKPGQPVAVGPQAAKAGPGSLPAGDQGQTGVGEGLKSLAAAGDARAQFEMGLRYADGRTVARDLKLAASWFEKAANQGFAPAQYRLGSAYEKGAGTTRDPALAMAWYGRAADAGNIRAMHNLAVMAAEGAVDKPDYAKAATWFQKAASFAVRDSQFNLAILYARGLGVPQSLAQSYTWFALAADQGDEDAAKKRDEVGQRLDAKTLASAKAAADSFKPGASVAAANETPPPPGGWDAVAPAKPAATSEGVKGAAPRVSSL